MKVIFSLKSYDFTVLRLNFIAIYCLNSKKGVLYDQHAFYGESTQQSGHIKDLKCLLFLRFFTLPKR